MISAVLQCEGGKKQNYVISADRLIFRSEESIHRLFLLEGMPWQEILKEFAKENLALKSK